VISSRGRRASGFTALAFVWSLALLVAALTVPAYGSATLVDENGRGVLLVVAVPALISLVVWLALWRKCSRGGRLSGALAWSAIAILAVFCLLAVFSIGVYVLPVAVLLARAAALTPSPAPSDGPA
jgi:hypothetical protein